MAMKRLVILAFVVMVIMLETAFPTFAAPMFNIVNGVLRHVDLNGETEIVVPSDVTNIWERTFMNKSGMTSVAIPDSVIGIGARAFSGCSDLTRVVIGNGVTNIGAYAFFGCSNLTSVTVNQYVCDRSIRQVFPHAYQAITNIVFGGGVTNIFYKNTSPYALSGCVAVKGMTFLGDAPAVDNYAFRSIDSSSCTVYVTTTSSGWNVEIPGMWKGLAIRYLPTPKFTIDEDGSLTEIELNGITDVIIPPEVSAISTGAFSNCRDDLTSITIGTNVTFIGERAFEGCCNLTNVVFLSAEMPNEECVVGAFAFRGCESLENVTIPSPYVRFIRLAGSGAFKGCIGMSDGDFVIVDGVLYDYIGEGVDVVMPDCVYCVDCQAFAGCSNLTSVVFSECLEYIGDEAFYGCSRLERIVFKGETLPEIESAFFWHGEEDGVLYFVGCGTARGCCLVYVRESLREWMWNHFSKYMSLLSWRLYTNLEMAFWEDSAPEANTVFSYDYNIGSSISPVSLCFAPEWTILTLARVSQVRDATVFSVGSSESGKSGFALASKGANLVTLSWWPADGHHVDLLSVNVENAEEQFHAYALRAFGNEVELFVDGVFSGRTKLDTLPPEEPWLCFLGIAGGFGGTGLRSSTLSAIDDWRLYDVPLSDENIAAYATLADTSTWYGRQGNATYVIRNGVLSDVVLGGETAFVVPDGVTAIDDYAFSSGYNYSLTDLVIPNSVTNIGAGAFAGISSLKNVTVNQFICDNTLQSIFPASYRPSITNIVIASGVTNIAYRAFYNCKELKSVTIPDSVATIGNYAFYCTGCIVFKFDGDAPDVSANAFAGTTSSCWAFVPEWASGYGAGTKWNGLRVERYKAMPKVADDAAPETVTNAIEMAGFADEAVKEAIGGSAAEYGRFKEWAGSVKGAGSASSAAAGEAAVVANTNVAAAYLLGAERLFENAPKIEFDEVSVADSKDGGLGTDRPTMTLSVTVKDGEEAVKCAAEKVKSLFRATSDLGDWNGAAKLDPEVSIEATDDPTTMRFKVTPGDGTSSRAFLQIRR